MYVAHGLVHGAAESRERGVEVACSARENPGNARVEALLVGIYPAKNFQLGKKPSGLFQVGTETQLACSNHLLLGKPALYPPCRGLFVVRHACATKTAWLGLAWLGLAWGHQS